LIAHLKAWREYIGYDIIIIIIIIIIKAIYIAQDRQMLQRR